MVALSPRTAHDHRLCRIRAALSAAYDRQYDAYAASKSDYFKGTCHGLQLAVEAIDAALDGEPLHVRRDCLDAAENEGRESRGMVAAGLLVAAVVLAGWRARVWG